MQRRSNAPARVLAAIALACGALAVIVVIASSQGGGSGSGGGGGSHPAKARAGHRASRPKTTAASYVVQAGDTLIAIAHKTGVPVYRIQQLNPEVDPQILIAGEKLKLR